MPTIRLNKVNMSFYPKIEQMEQLIIQQFYQHKGMFYYILGDQQNLNGNPHGNYQANGNSPINDRKGDEKFEKLKKAYQNLEKKCSDMENANSKLRSEIEGLQKIHEKKKTSNRSRRTQSDLEKSFSCMMPSCKKEYASKVALSLHMRLKHSDYQSQQFQKSQESKNSFRSNQQIDKNMKHQVNACENHGPRQNLQIITLQSKNNIERGPWNQQAKNETISIQRQQNQIQSQLIKKP